MEKITQEELNEIIANHKKYIEKTRKTLILDTGEINQENFFNCNFRAVLENKDLSRLDFLQADLRDSVFRECNFALSDLFNVDFSYADLSKSSFYQANLDKVNLQYTNLTDTNFTGSKFIVRGKL